MGRDCKKELTPALVMWSTIQPVNKGWEKAERKNSPRRLVMWSAIRWNDVYAKETKHDFRRWRKVGFAWYWICVLCAGVNVAGSRRNLRIDPNAHALPYPVPFTSAFMDHRHPPSPDGTQNVPLIDSYRNLQDPTGSDNRFFSGPYRKTPYRIRYGKLSETHGSCWIPIFGSFRSPTVGNYRNIWGAHRIRQGDFDLGPPER